MWRIGLTLVGVILAWRIGALGVARLYDAELATADRDVAGTAQQALDWHGTQPDALYQLGLSRLRRDPDTARALLAEAYRLNPTRAQPLLALSALALTDGQPASAEHWVDAAAKLAPVKASVQEEVAAYWATQGRLDRAFVHWTRAIEAGSPRTRTLFSGFRELLATPIGLAAFRDLARDPPTWWESFFIETAQGKTPLELVQALYDMRRAPSAVPLSTPERMAYIERLLREKAFEAAYLAWINSLVPAQRQQSGFLYNGTFEVPFTGFGFDWHVLRHDRASIARAPTEGGRGQALRITFRFTRSRFEHFYQPLYLAPGGTYRISGRYRSDKLYTESGLRWALNCRDPDSQTLGESPRILGSEEWTTFSFEVEVPEECAYQELRLASVDTLRRDEAIDGSLWFDDLAIVRIPAMSPLERARTAARRSILSEEAQPD
ncbi:hypothetical protein CKO25_10435 [Thiocapsa imhoffii]|uniref:Tetratricopeptide repeat protein n=1 Tax=Thiocapsa imhoffii TaxID=382777 RepID=A0A9X1B8R0_9GAMM|nr:hypothetical protein [Thiocapsa imhoffii]